MNKFILPFCILAFSVTINAQVSFTKVTNGAIATTLSDSRSVNFVDVNLDGWEDLFISNGPEDGQNNFLYINNGNGQLLPLADDPIVQDFSPSDGATFADADNDGDLDAFVVTWHGHINYYYQNNGDGSFTHLEDVLTGNSESYSETASWGDYDQDGLVDIVLTNSYINLKNELYRNAGDQTFESITIEELTTNSRTSRSVNWVDYNGDGHMDIFVTNESNQKNELYTNNGDGNFTKVETGPVASSARGSMSSSWSDIDNDGDLDLLIANAGYFQEQNNQLFINMGNGTFQSADDPLTTDGGCSYGSAFADIDNDGDEDLLIANGYCNSNLQDYLYINDGQGNFSRDMTSLEGLPEACSFGCAWGDYNNDGFLDLAIAHCSNNTGSIQPPNSLFRNSGNTNNWLKIKLEGNVSNRSAIGAIIRTKALIQNEWIWQMRQISAQSGYCGQNSLIAHFGLADATQVDSIIVEWPSGITNVLTAQDVNQELHLQENPISGTSSVTAEEKIHIQCTPNPSNGPLNITINGIKDSFFKLIILDSLGRRIPNNSHTFNTSSTHHTDVNINLNELPAGQYYVYVQSSTSFAIASFQLH